MDIDINHSLEIPKEEDEEKYGRSRMVTVAIDNGNNNKYVVRWALNHLVSCGESLVLIHVRPPILAIPNPCTISSSFFNIMCGGWGGFKHMSLCRKVFFHRIFA